MARGTVAPLVQHAALVPRVLDRYQIKGVSVKIFSQMWLAGCLTGR